MAVQRISPREARQKVQQGEALLVCAYDSMEKFGQFHLEGALSLEAFRGRLAELPKNREIIFYCA
jgi:rhodanese-related sulfurtransferase